jgi:hypothetical protein
MADSRKYTRRGRWAPASSVVGGDRLRRDGFAPRTPVALRVGADEQTGDGPEGREGVDADAGVRRTGTDSRDPPADTEDHAANGDVREVVAADSGNMSDIEGWAESTDDVELVDQVEGDGIYTHYVRKTE